VATVFLIFIYFTVFKHLNVLISFLQRVDLLNSKTLSTKSLPSYHYQDEIYFLAQSIDLMLEQIVVNFETLQKSELIRTKDQEEIRILSEVLERKVKDRTSELEKANVELRSFAHIISHDLKGPLRGLATISNWLYKDYQDRLDDVGKEQLKLLEYRSRHLYELVDRLLEYSKADDTHDILFDKMSHDAIIKRAIDEINKNKAEIKIVSPFNHLPKLLISNFDFYKVICSLLSNAIKFNNNEQPFVEIGFLEFDKMIQFFIKDNGPGIAPKYQKKVFEVFQTLENEASGTGIGLAIVKRIVKKSDGDVWIESNGIEGTVVKFSIKKV
jgi:light-regulated signal transduction histidine kinase (bacteriophytochrome)